ncbi:MAG: glucosaminidase domain-containing protein [Bacteroidota bacterium]
MFSRFTPLTFNKQQVFSQTSQWLQRNWIKCLGLVLFAYVLIHKDLNFSLNLNGSNPTSAYAITAALPLTDESPVATSAAFSEEKNTTTSSFKSTVKKEKVSAPTLSVRDDNLANTYSNMTYTFGKSWLEESKRSEWKSKRKKQETYVERFAKIAQAEMKKYGIPASITLAQGLIETNAGDSRLAKQNNNHFGMKCFSKKCRKGHCSNFTDDTHKDFFRKYKSSWESYRAHSQLLMGKRYRHLKKLGTKNYKDWARGLKKAGYATDRRYAEKLINIIEELRLQRFDQ